MPKHPLHEPSLPPAKRLHTTSGSSSDTLPRLVALDQVFTDEIVLCIFSHLDWPDLCVTQSASRNWARLAADNELWKVLYMRVYGRSRLRGAKGFINRSDGREVKALPGRADDGEVRDWKAMFRISSNWRRGRCKVETFPSDVQGHGGPLDRGVHLLIAGPLTILASANSSLIPTVRIRQNSGSPQTVISTEKLSTPASITAICLDQSPPNSHQLSLACFLSNGSFQIFRFNATHPTNATKIYAFSSPLHARTRAPNRVVQAAYYHPLLVTLSDDFELVVFTLSAHSVRQTQSLSSFTSYPPSSLVLSAPSASTFKLVLAYSIPVYPHHWSIGATELIISNGAQVALSSTSPFTPHPAFTEDFRGDSTTSSESLSVVATRTIRAIDVPNGWIDERRLRVMREQWARKVSSVAATQTDGKWLVLAPGTSSNGSLSSPSPSSNTHLHSSSDLQLYRLVLPPHSSSVAAAPPKLTFVRMLHGQTSDIAALALADGRCVSLGCDGSIWVWDLENGTGAEVAPADGARSMGSSREGAISFDERRIVTACAGRLAFRRFDI